jgi:hypothetical protein
MKKEQTRTELMRALHSVASAQLDMKDSHPILHQMAVVEFGVASMSHISVKELQIMIDKIKLMEIDWTKIEALGLTRIPEMSVNQKTLVKKLQRELGWSDDYMLDLVIQRYGYLHYRYLTGRAAFAFCNYLIHRSHSKRKHEKETA